MNYIFNTCAIIGPGLIGGSIGLGLKKLNLVERIIGIGRRQESINAAVNIGAIDSGTMDIRNGVQDADIVIAATPVSLITQNLKSAIPYLKKGALITDVGSTKSFILQELKDATLNSGAKTNDCFEFIGAHPIAGSENKGAEYAESDLFVNSICVLTPTESNSKSGIDKLTKMWKLLGAKVISMRPEEHDAILARTSHLPQVLAYAIANIIENEQWKFSAGGLKDLTRIAASDPNLWIDICGQNRSNIINSIDLFIKELSRISSNLSSCNDDQLKEIFANARKHRNAYYNIKND